MNKRARFYAPRKSSRDARLAAPDILAAGAFP